MVIEFLARIYRTGRSGESGAWPILDIAEENIVKTITKARFWRNSTVDVFARFVVVNIVLVDVLIPRLVVFFFYLKHLSSFRKICLEPRPPFP